MTANHRVLLIAEAANPEWVSVPLVGWHIANALRQVADVHVVTQVRNKAAFERAGLAEGVDFTAINTEALAAPMYKLADVLRGGQGKGWTTLTAVQSLTYFYFERLVWKRFKDQIRSGAFDIVHRVTPLSPTAPSSLARKCAKAGIPFILGPLNGGLPWPAGFDGARRKEKEWLSYVRGFYKYMPGVRATYRAATAIIVASRHTASELRQAHADKLISIPENGIDGAQFKPVTRQASAGVLRLCFIGRLVPYKCPDVALESAAALLRAGKARFAVIGDGPMLDELKALAARLGVEQAVTFHGWLAHEQVATVAAESDIFVFPSVREFGGGVVLEAMAVGMVPIVVDYGGPGEIVTPQTGFAIPMGGRATILSAITKRLNGIAAGEHDIAAMSRFGVERVATLYFWSEKAKQIRSVYDWALLKSKDKPEFFSEKNDLRSG